MPKINEMILKLEGFEYATTLDFNMVYYHIAGSRRHCKLMSQFLLAIFLFRTVLVYRELVFPWYFLLKFILQYL